MGEQRSSAAPYSATGGGWWVMQVCWVPPWLRLVHEQEHASHSVTTYRLATLSPLLIMALMRVWLRQTHMGQQARPDL